ncbi:MAG: hypothetical protein ACPKQO_11505 [Nitrososphaeraceae archaeon]
MLSVYGGLNVQKQYDEDDSVLIVLSATMNTSEGSISCDCVYQTTVSSEDKITSTKLFYDQRKIEKYLPYRVTFLN